MAEVDVGLLQSFRDTWRPETEQELARYVERYLRVRVPSVAVCEGHTSPLQFVSDVYFSRRQDVMLVAHRTGGKTMNLAILHALNCGHKAACDITSVGAIVRQAQQCYEYHRQLVWENPVLQSWIKAPPMISKCEYVNGNKLEILPGTINAVNSPHPNIAAIDEFDLMDWRIFQQALSMPVSSSTVPKTTLLASTRKTAFGPVQRLLSDIAAGNSEFKGYTYCVFETLRNCTAAGEDCAACKAAIRGDGKSFWDVCQGKGKRAQGFQRLSDIVSQFRKLDPQVFDAEWLCLKPESQSLVYPTFDSGNKAMIHRVEYDPNLETYAGVDFGTVAEHQFFVLVFQIAGNGQVRVIHELVLPGAFPEEYLDLVLDIQNRYGVISFGCDRSDSVQIRAMRNGGIEAVAANSGFVKDGHSFIHSLLVPDGSRLAVDEGCKEFIRQMSVLHYPVDTSGRITNKDRHVRVDDHGEAAFRYGLANAGLYGSKEVATVAGMMV